jgi:dual specificity phosphatase 12
MVTEAAKCDETCRVLLIGSNKTRLNKVLSLLLPQKKFEALQAPDVINLNVEYLPCVATFASYKDESKSDVRYLEKIEYFPHDSHGALALTKSSLLPIFDEIVENRVYHFPSVAGVAIGCGIEGHDDTARIEAFIQTMASGSTSQKSRPPKVRAIEPNPCFKSMFEELSAYKQLTSEEKVEANRLQTLGPEKMVKFIVDFTNEILSEVLDQPQSRGEVVIDDKSSEQLDSSNPDEESTMSVPRTVDRTKNIFLCRMCRIILFCEGDLQDPPHEASRHRFSHKKIHHGSVSSTGTALCQSYFLQNCLAWMGEDIRNGVPEGKLSCPKCDGKVGTWIWSGTQCSCGTWVVPAIQIPKSKVDVVAPNDTPASTQAPHQRIEALS